MIILALAIVPSLLDDDGPTTYDIGVAGPDAAELQDALAAPIDPDVQVDVSTVDDRSAAEDLVNDGELDAVIDGTTVLVEEEASDQLLVVLETANRSRLLQSALTEEGVPPEQAAAVTEVAPLEVDALDPVDEEENTRRDLAMVGSFLLYGQIIGFGFWVAGGVVEEKTSRVAEVLLAKVRPLSLMVGKVLGLGLLGLGQLMVFIGVGLGAAIAVDTVDLPPGWASVVALLVVWFLLGYAFYASLYAMAGVIAARQEEMQSTTTPITFVLIAAFFAVFAAAAEPEGTVATVTTFLPPSAPLVVPVRIAAGAIPAWQVVAAVVITVATIVVLLRLAARIYAGGLLRTRKVSLAQAWRSAS